MFANLTSTAVRTVVGTAGMAVCAGLCLVGATAPAHAAAVRTATVSYADLDIATAKGRAKLSRRVAAAARAVCTSADAAPVAQAEEGRCVRHAVATARPVVG